METGTAGEKLFCLETTYAYNKKVIMKTTETRPVNGEQSKTTINFKEFRLFTDITQTETVVVDSRKELADLMYKNLNGIVAHDLALRIFRSEGEMELNEEEEMIVLRFAEKTTPIFYDSLKMNLKKHQIL